MFGDEIKAQHLDSKRALNKLVLKMKSKFEMRYEFNNALFDLICLFE